MRLTRLFAALLPLALLVGCLPYTVNHDYDISADFSRYRTFDYYTSKKGTGGTTTLMDKRVRTLLEKELLAKGFKKETQADPDFLVTYYPVVHQQHYRTTTHVGWGWGWGYYPGYGHMGTSVSQVHQYTEGTIVIEIVDFKTNQMVWHGAAVGALNDTGSPEETNEIVSGAIRDILAKFPPGPAKKG